MRVETLDLHGLSVEEALSRTRQSLFWCLEHRVEVLDINHGKGHHSQRNFSVIKKEIRKMLREEEALQEYGYRVIAGEANFPVALTFDEGHTLVVARGVEHEYLGGSKQRQKNLEIYSKEARQARKQKKSRRR
jgi:hypothetical protein